MSLGSSTSIDSLEIDGVTVRSQRVPKKKFQYAVTQLDEVGRDWESKEGDRVYKSPDGQNKTGLTDADVAAIDFSKSFMLPYNESGVHWAAFAVNVIKVDGVPQVNIRFTDSLGKTQKFDELPEKVKAEADRIAGLFGESAVVTKEVYKDTWMQDDVVSCGPYCLANAERALAGKVSEPDPGEEAVRVEQLAVMRSPAAIKACSSNSLVDTMLTEWMLSRGGGKPMLPEGDFVNQVCEYFNSINPQPDGVDALKAIFTNEYGASETQLKARLNELSIDMGFAKTTPELIEDVRSVLESKVGAEASYQKMSNFMQSLSGIGGFLGDLETSSRDLLDGLSGEDRAALQPMLKQIDSNIRFTENERNQFNDLKDKYGVVATHLAIGSDLTTALSEAGLHEAPSDMSRASTPASITSRPSAGAGSEESFVASRSRPPSASVASLERDDEHGVSRVSSPASIASSRADSEDSFVTARTWSPTSSMDSLAGGNDERDVSRASSPASVASGPPAGAGSADSVVRSSPASMSTSSDTSSRRSSASSVESVASTGLDKIRDDLERGGAELAVGNILGDEYSGQEMLKEMCTNALREGEDLTKEKIEGFLDALSEAQRVSISRSPSPTSARSTSPADKSPTQSPKRGLFSRIFGRR